MRIRDGKSDVSSPGLMLGAVKPVDEDIAPFGRVKPAEQAPERRLARRYAADDRNPFARLNLQVDVGERRRGGAGIGEGQAFDGNIARVDRQVERAAAHAAFVARFDHLLDARHRRDRLAPARSEEHTSELQSLMRISYAVFCLKKKKKQ